jgi:hypothetical protein
MPFQLSPGVNVSEIDLTTVVPAVAATGGCIAGEFAWGPIMERKLLGDEDSVANMFGKPTNTTAISFFTAANFLAYGNSLQIVRVAQTGQANATTDGSTGSDALLIENDEDWENNWEGGQNVVSGRYFAAKYAGALGNTLKVSVCPSAAAFRSTVNVSTTGATLTLTSGDPEDHLAVGSLVIYGGETRQVEAITDGVSATLDSGFSSDISADDAIFEWEYATSFDGAPGTSPYAEKRGASNDEMHVAVIDEDGEFSGTKGEVVEKFAFVSKAPFALNADGSTNNYKNVIDRRSFFIRWMDHNAGSNTNWDTPAANGVDYNGTPITMPSTWSLAGGANGVAASDAQKINGYDMFANAEEVDVSLILGADANQTIALHLVAMAESRMDCVTFLSPEFSDVVNNAGSEATDIVEFRNSLPSSSYAFLDGNWKYQYDKYNDVYRWVPFNGDVAGLVVRATDTRDAWWSPAGFNRGGIKNVVKTAWTPSKTYRDELYKNNINPILVFPGEGCILFGDKTLLAKPSAFDRINVRRLFIVMEKAIATAAKYSLFEFNDQFTRSMFRNMVEPFLRDVQGRRGIYDFRVVCDESNNTGEVIDRNEFIGDIYVKPARSINFIQLNFVAVRTGVDFSEVVGQF